MMGDYQRIIIMVKEKDPWSKPTSLSAPPTTNSMSLLIPHSVIPPILVLEDAVRKEMKESEEETSKAFQAITQTREEIDKLAHSFIELCLFVNCDFYFLLVEARLIFYAVDLLKLDTIEAEGEARGCTERLRYVVSRISMRHWTT